MSAHIFDGTTFANQKEMLLRHQVLALPFQIKVKTLVFEEDPAGLLYTRLKQETAERVSINFDPEYVSINTPIDELCLKVKNMSADTQTYGVMIQKPMKSIWDKHSTQKNLTLSDFWQQLVSQIDPAKDVDCLSPSNQNKIYEGKWEILPATAQAILSILEYASKTLNLFENLNTQTIVVLGKSDIVGNPVAAVLKQARAEVKHYGKEVNLNTDLKTADIVISATGIAGLVKAEHLKKNCIVIDIGSPGADCDFEAVSTVAKFITPVPFGVGPVTVITLMENAYKLLPPLNDV